MSRHFMVFAVVSAFALACSSTADPGTGGSTNGTSPAGTGEGTGTGTGTNTASSKYSCCINDVHYKCPDQAAFDKCAGTPAGGQDCEAKCAPGDVPCIMACADARSKASHDPSACTKTTEACPSTNSCNNVGTRSCQVDGDCDSGNHCTGGKCYSNSAGSKCDVDGDCGSGNHCTSGCCLGNETGSACDVDGDCGSGNHCTGGKCYANKLGSPCDVDGDCGAGNECTNGRCR
ncbi:MAG: hypothetical protein JST00_17760 [Deltaproteobacteria bacterium]|nr:hypothetical protein [Deltaproteobacteria bacterium]